MIFCERATAAEEGMGAAVYAAGSWLLVLSGAGVSVGWVAVG